MSIPLIDIAGVRKDYGGLRPLRLNALTVAPGERVTMRGVDAAAAEMLMLMVTGASLPDEGAVRVAGRDTREIATDVDWLASLDMFGMVTARAVLLDSLPLEANLALPLTLSVDPVPEDVRAVVARLAVEVGLDGATLPNSLDALSDAQRLRVHLARALALDPKVLLLEHPTAALHPDEAADFGRLVADIADRRSLAWLALSEDEAFAAAAGGRRCHLVAASGDLREGPQRLWEKLW